MFYRCTKRLPTEAMNEKILLPICNSNPIVFLDISIGQEFAGRIIIELRRDVVPKAAENFRGLCTGEYGIGTLGGPLHYKGVRFHKVKRVYVAQGGDVVNNDGSSGESIYGPYFEDENFDLLHEEGVISMANYGKPHTNNSQFVITSIACENLNGTNVVCGRVLRGFGIVGDMEQNTTDESVPTENIVIIDCGELLPGEDWGVEDDDETMDKLPPYPQDWHHKFDSFETDEMVTILMSIRNAGNHFFSQQLFYEARRKYRKADRYYNMFRKRNEWEEFEHLNYSDEDIKKLNSFSVVNNVNMAAVEVKIEKYASAKHHSSEALRLDPNCCKAYYRRGQAQIGLKNYDEAISDLKRANELMPNNKDIINELNRVKKLMSDYNRKQMHALKNLFN